MITVVKKVYYCEHCKRHRLTAAPILKHESRCIYNPDRSACGWHADRKPIGHARTIAEKLKEHLDVDLLRKEVEGCPACMLAAVVQAGLTDSERWDLGFSYQEEIERVREQERQDRYADAF